MRLEDGQAVQLEDGTTAFIHHTSKGKLTVKVGVSESGGAGKIRPAYMC